MTSALDVPVVRPGPAEPEPGLDLLVEVSGPRAVVHLAGGIDAATGADVEAVVDELLDTGCRQLAVEVSGLDRADEAGWVALWHLARAVRRAGGTCAWSCDVRSGEEADRWS